jgi:hypothetical protein
MKKKGFYNLSVLTFSILMFTGIGESLPAQPILTDSLKKSFGLFEQDNLIEITLRFDLSTYFRTKPQDEYLKTNITFHLSKSDSISRDIKLKTRGVFRNQFCMFAPIELNLKKADFGYTDLNRITKLKLVPQCNSGRDKEDYVLREYLAYKLFNVLTDTSFRVRLLTVNYIDSEKKKKSVRQFGFFIEPVEMLVGRTNCIQIKTTTLNQKSIIPRIMDRLAIFNYMIGNYDWSVPGLHNILVIKPMESEPNAKLIAIPHDFDWTGLVNASYAIPAEIVGTENVRERIFEGICRKKEVFYKDLDLFLLKKEEFYRVINEFPYINQRVKKDITGYLDGFFINLAGKREIILFNIMNTCKNF